MTGKTHTSQTTYGLLKIIQIIVSAKAKRYLMFVLWQFHRHILMPNGSLQYTAPLIVQHKDKDLHSFIFCPLRSKSNNQKQHSVLLWLKHKDYSKLQSRVSSSSLVFFLDTDPKHGWKLYKDCDMWRWSKEFIAPVSTVIRSCWTRLWTPWIDEEQTASLRCS